jgi:hypothetical protein
MSMLKGYRLVILALVIGLCLSLYGINNHAFWDDEAHTALFAQNLLSTGKMTAWDGKNLIGYNQGAGLDENLVNDYMPPLQFIVAAAGLTLFDDKTFGGRILFVLAGMLAVLALSLWTHRHFVGRVPVYLPALIVCLSPAYLLFVRQCRYYALGVFFTFALLAAWSWCDASKRMKLIAYLVGIAATAGLWFTHYLYAMAALAAMPVFYAEPHYRSKSKHVFLGVVYLVALICGLYILQTKNPFSVVPADDISGLPRYATLLMRHLGGLALFEFLPVLLLPVLLLPSEMNRIRHLENLGKSGFILLYAMLMYICVTVLFTPQHVRITAVAEMRYVVPLILLGATLTAAILLILWQVSKPIAVIIAVIAIFTNTFTLSYLSYPPWRIAILEYMNECQRGYKTSTESVVEYVSSIPSGSVVQIIPFYMAYSPMFYEPQQHYCCQLNESKAVRTDLKAQLPDYIFTERARPDYVLSMLMPEEKVKTWLDNKFGKDRYEIIQRIANGYYDCSRPEIFLHCFGPPPRSDEDVISIFRYRSSAGTAVAES